MAGGNIDSASLMDAVNAYASHNNLECLHRSYENWDEWTRKSIYSVTMLQIGDPLIMAPAPAKRFQNTDPHSELYKCYDKVLESFKINLRETGSQTLQKGYDAKRNEEEFSHLLNAIEPNDISHIVKKTKKEASYESWIEWAIKEACMRLRLRPQSLPKPFPVDMRIKCLT